jgi:hypothetical protein
VFNDICPADQVVIGYRGTVANPGIIVIGSIQTICASLDAIYDGSSYAFVTSSETALPTRGGTGTAWQQLCPPNQVVTAFNGRSGTSLDQIAFGCAVLSAAVGGVVLSAPTFLTPAGGNGGSAYSEACPAGQIARGSNTRTTSSESWVDAFGLVCGSPSLATR